MDNSIPGINDTMESIDQNSNKKDQIEKITCSAIWVQCIEGTHRPKNISTGYVIAGHRHCNCIETFSKMDPRIDGKRGDVSNQGFLTNKNRYVGREEALKIAIEANQLIARHSDNILYSEDIY